MAAVDNNGRTERECFDDFKGFEFCFRKVGFGMDRIEDIYIEPSSCNAADFLSLASPKLGPRGELRPTTGSDGVSTSPTAEAHFRG